MKLFTMTRTGLITTILVISLMIWDLLAVLIGGTGSSVSNFLINVSILSPVVCFGFGWIMCHLLGGQMFLKETKVYANANEAVYKDADHVHLQWREDRTLSDTHSATLIDVKKL